MSYQIPIQWNAVTERVMNGTRRLRYQTLSFTDEDTAWVVCVNSITVVH